MSALSTIELKDLKLDTNIGTYGPEDVVPEHHLLDLSLKIARSAVLIPEDGMTHVFDYDPLIVDILNLARQGHRDTQEWLITQIIGLCASYSDILGVEIFLRKTPVHAGTGTLGVRISVDHAELGQVATAGMT